MMSGDGLYLLLINPIETRHMVSQSDLKKNRKDGLVACLIKLSLQ